jgi:2-polyprenyl-3-methyl-5-hydroxy-6-metoxy-1,4-benzoquinol methylase
MEYDQYFEFRQIEPTSYTGFEAPAYLKMVLGSHPSARILDFGCGYGQLAKSLRASGFANIETLDVSQAAIAHCRSEGFVCHDGNDASFFETHTSTYDFVILSHVMEHVPKLEAVSLLQKVVSLLKLSGAAIVAVPNAQSNTGCYWAYEDFTHYTLFTAGSLYYVLRAAGFSRVEFLDPDCLEGLGPAERIVKKALLGLYKANYAFWNRVTSSAIHRPSPMIFSYEVKALARR